ncbi:MAG: glycerol-3-phosphate dehydrogenase [Pseudomonadota bacterium]
MREGSLEAPERHALDWNNPEFYDEEALDRELRRVFDICHGCRRCFNLCDSFPNLFDLVDESETGEVDGVSSADFHKVVDQCTLCDMCFMVKCPYVPPHEFNLDFPHLMLRYRAVEHRKGKHGFITRRLSNTDANGKLASGPQARTVNHLVKSRPVRTALEKIAGVDAKAELPTYAQKTLSKQAAELDLELNRDAPAFGRKAVIYAGCHGQYSQPQIGIAAMQVLAKNGIASKIVYPRCCGMPQMELGDLDNVARRAVDSATDFMPFIEEGYDVIALTPSCALMMKFEWPLMLPDHALVAKLGASVFDLDEYLIRIARKEGLAEITTSLDGQVGLHIACHARAQNIGRKAEEVLKLIPGAKIKTVEKCSGHGGVWGTRKEHFKQACKQGKPVARMLNDKGKSRYLVSECPLAATHLGQVGQMEGHEQMQIVAHPVLLLAQAYGYQPAIA